uniref:Uncharacterized protein n=1 Tax=viral metagenome TaxID=1070528 RepID=A0A6M3JB82_9ZZZZ
MGDKICPLITAGHETDVPCLKENCQAWGLCRLFVSISLIIFIALCAIVNISLILYAMAF